MQGEIAPTDSAALYKNATTNQWTIDHKHLQFIEAYEDQRILIGACNLNGRFWNGSIRLYDDCADFNSNAAIADSITESAPCDAVIIDSDKLAVVEDCGSLQVLQLVDDPNAESKRVECLGYACQHDDAITSVSAFRNRTRVVTGGADRCIKVWNLLDLLAEHSWEGAHTKTITCVDARPDSDDVFASSSSDCEAVIWDSRRDTPAQVVNSKPGRQLQAVAWHPGDDNILAVGSTNGDVALIDVRKPEDFVTHSAVFRRPIHKIKFDRKRPHLLATCCDGTVLKVLDTTKAFATVYHDDRHGDFVRGIAWYKDDLLSCSWDNTVLRHNIREDDN